MWGTDTTQHTETVTAQETAAQDAKAQLCGQLDDVDTTIFFLILIVLSVLLSFWATNIQRQQLCLTIQGETEAAAAIPPVYPLRISASALVIGSLGYFLSLALKGCCTASQGDDCIAQESASTNVWASILVLVAAVIRLIDLVRVERCRDTQTTVQQEESALTEEADL